MSDIEPTGTAPWSATCTYVELSVRNDEASHVGTLAGELDVDGSAAVVRACTLPGQIDVVVDVAGLTFMDCAGYGALVASRNALRARGGSLRVRDPRGEPLRLLTLVDAEIGPGAALPRDATPD